MEGFFRVIDYVNDFLWSYIVITLLVLTLRLFK